MFALSTEIRRGGGEGDGRQSDGRYPKKKEI